MPFRFMRSESFVSFGRKIAGVRIERLEKSVQRAIGHLGNVGLFDILATDPREHLAVHLQLAVGAVVRRGVDASHRTYDDEEKYCKGGDEDRCFGFHGHLSVIFFRKELLSRTEIIISLDAKHHGPAARFEPYR